MPNYEYEKAVTANTSLTISAVAGILVKPITRQGLLLAARWNEAGSPLGPRTQNSGWENKHQTTNNKQRTTNKRRQPMGSLADSAIENVIAMLQLGHFGPGPCLLHSGTVDGASFPTYPSYIL